MLKKSQERTIPQSSITKLFELAQITPQQGVIFHMLLATAPQRCKLWRNQISTEAAAGREEELSVMIVKCQCKMKVNKNNELKDTGTQRNPLILFLFRRESIAIA